MTYDWIDWTIIGLLIALGLIAAFPRQIRRMLRPVRRWLRRR